MTEQIFPFPHAFLERLDALVSPSEKQIILQSLCTDTLPAVRVNTLKISRDQLIELFTTHGVECKPVHWYADAFVIYNKTTRELTEIPEYRQGFFYIQSLSSMIPALALEPCKGDKILDLAAAPGSKTTHIAALMNNTGEILANEISRNRVYKLEENLRQQGVTNTKIRIGLGEKVWQDYPEYFDKTLVDVPCSMEGRFTCNDPASYTHWSVKKVKMLAKQQQWLLRAAISATKPGGIIVYSTCTLSPEENEGVIDWILRKEQGTVAVLDSSFQGIPKSIPIRFWNTRLYNPDVALTLRIHSSAQMEGFFIAKLKKISSNVSSAY